MSKLNLHRFWRCHENGLIKTIQMISRILSVSFKLASFYWGTFNKYVRMKIGLFDPPPPCTQNDVTQWFCMCQFEKSKKGSQKVSFKIKMFIKRMFIKQIRFDLLSRD